MKAIIYLFTTCILLSTAACKKQFDKLSPEEKLTGKWKLTSSGGGFTGKYGNVDPSVNIILTFKSKSLFTASINNQVTESGTYEIIKTEYRNTIQFNSAAPYKIDIISVTQNTLSLGDNMSYTYKKVD